MLPAPLPALDLPTLSRALDGDRRALARVYTSHHPLVLAAARRALASLRLPEPPAELAAEVWLRLLERGCRRLRAFDPTRGSFRRFLSMVAGQQARAVAHRWARQRQHEEPGLVLDLFASPAPCITTAMHHRWLLERVLAEVPRITALDLALLHACLLDRTPARELVPRLGRSPHAIHKHNQRLRDRLRHAARRLERAPRPLAA